MRYNSTTGKSALKTLQPKDLEIIKNRFESLKQANHNAIKSIEDREDKYKRIIHNETMCNTSERFNLENNPFKDS